MQVSQGAVTHFLLDMITVAVSSQLRPGAQKQVEVVLGCGDYALT